ncbi:MAG: cache domain-containing protein [Candidatus Gracilibacteria bacterium]|nr:cache domain-containing protein [Candidatus Gracilibacteria bacterium]
MPKNTYTVKEVADLLGFSTNTVYKYLAGGGIKSVRLGLEGRFRIPRNEVERLLQERGKSFPLISGSDENGQHSADASNHYRPSLFDWFVAFLSISIGFSIFILPMPGTIQTVFGLHKAIIPLQTLLLIGGFLILVLDMFRMCESKLRKLINLVMGLDYFASALIFAFAYAMPLTVGYLAISIVVILSVFIKMTQYTRFMLFVNLMLLFLGVGVLGWPDSFFLAGIMGVTSKNLTIFFFAWSLLLVFNIYITYFAMRKNKHFIWFCSLPTALTALSYATISFTQGFWARSVFCVVLASFAVIFPFADEFEAFTLRSKREVVGSFAWLLGLFLVGSLMLYYIFRSFQSYGFSELTNRVDTAGDVTITFMNENMAKISTFAADEELIEAMKNYTGGNVESANYNLKQLYQASDWTIQRVVLVDKNGIILDTYPLNTSSIGVNIKNRDYFKSVEVENQPFVSGVEQPSALGLKPVVLVSVPINDTSGNFLGVLMGDVDIKEMTRRINQVKFGQSGNYLLADSTGKYIIPPTPDQIMMKASPGSHMLRAVLGENSAVQGESTQGRLSLIAFKQITKYGWGIVAEQPVDEAFNPYSKTVFLTFLIYVTAGVGSLILIFSSQKKNKAIYSNGKNFHYQERKRIKKMENTRRE